MIGTYFVFEDEDLKQELEKKLGLLALSLANYLYATKFDEMGHYLPFAFSPNTSVIIDLFEPMIFKVIFERKNASFSLQDGSLILSNIKLTDEEMKRIQLFYGEKKEAMLEIQRLPYPPQSSPSL